MEDTQYQLIVEQLGRMKDNIESRFKRLETLQDHFTDLDRERLNAIKAEIQDLKEISKDHETRLRSNTDSITTHKTSLSMAQALQITLTLIASAAAAWLGSR